MKHTADRRIRIGFWSEIFCLHKTHYKDALHRLYGSGKHLMHMRTRASSFHTQYIRERDCTCMIYNVTFTFLINKLYIVYIRCAFNFVQLKEDFRLAETKLLDHNLLHPILSLPRGRRRYYLRLATAANSPRTMYSIYSRWVHGGVGFSQFSVVSMVISSRMFYVH